MVLALVGFRHFSNNCPVDIQGLQPRIIVEIDNIGVSAAEERKAL